MMEKVFKIVEKEGNQLRTLFHGIDGTRVLPTETLLFAKHNWVRDGSGGTKYISGIHVFKDKKIAEKYLKKFKTKRNRVIIECFAEELRVKPTNKDVYLANMLFIPSKNDMQDFK